MNIYTSIIIPAFNAQETIGKALDSLLAQSCKKWEAIVIDDGSTDQTAAIVNNCINNDKRIVLISQPNRGAAAARNRGINAACFNWILFLDADDWISEVFLERMTYVLENNDATDAVHCGWNLVAPDGTLLGEKFALAENDLFPSFARTCAFVVHACIFRKSLLTASGVFDETYVVCQDWDFWQRLARTGACFQQLREVHAFYRMLPGSLSKKVKLSLIDFFKIINQGHIADPRVAKSKQDYVNGLVSEDLNAKLLYCFTWFAGLFIGQNGDAGELFTLLHENCKSNLDPQVIGDYLFESLCFSTCQSQKEWLTLWHKNKEGIKNFLTLLEAQSQTDGLQIHTLDVLMSLIIDHADINEPLIINTTYACMLELTEPIPDIHSSGVDTRCVIRIKMEGVYLGLVELLFADGIVMSESIKDAIAAKFSWKILKRYFDYTVYSKILPDLKTGDEYAALTGQLHEETGWLEFLRQLWGKEGWRMDEFYNTTSKKKKGMPTEIYSTPILIEMSLPIPDFKSDAANFIAEVSIGGLIIGTINLPVLTRFVSSQSILVEITKNGGYPLCIACVRQALIGRPLADNLSIPQRLQQSTFSPYRNKTNIPILT